MTTIIIFTDPTYNINIYITAYSDLRNVWRYDQILLHPTYFRFLHYLHSTLLVHNGNENNSIISPKLLSPQLCTNKTFSNQFCIHFQSCWYVNECADTMDTMVFGGNRLSCNIYLKLMENPSLYSPTKTTYK